MFKRNLGSCQPIVCSPFISSVKGQKQQGATLVVALVILLIMSIMAISNMQSSTLQERMASNDRQKTLAKYAAESALHVAESWLDTNVTGISDLAQFNGSNGLFSAVKIAASFTAAPSSASISDVTDAAAWGVVTAYVDAADIIDASTVSKQPQYIIEYIGRDYRGTAGKVINTDDFSAPSNNYSAKPFFFRITTIGWGKDPRIYSVLEAIYKTGSAEYFNY